MIGSGDYISREAALDVNVKDYPPYLDYPKPRKPKTNADRIRAMSDEELAVILAKITEPNKLPMFHGLFMNGEKDVFLDWLREEATE